jgi:hypothetical protein
LVSGATILAIDLIRSRPRTRKNPACGRGGLSFQTCCMLRTATIRNVQTPGGGLVAAHIREEGREEDDPEHGRPKQPKHRRRSRVPEKPIKPEPGRGSETGKQAAQRRPLIIGATCRSQSTNCWRHLVTRGDGRYSHAVREPIRGLRVCRHRDSKYIGPRPPMRRLARAGRGCERRLAIASPQWCGDNDPRDPLGSSNAQALSLQYTCSPSGGFPYHRPPTRGCLNNVPDISACLEWARLLEGSTWSSTYLVCRWSLSSLASP